MADIGSLSPSISSPVKQKLPHRKAQRYSMTWNIHLQVVSAIGQRKQMYLQWSELKCIRASKSNYPT